MAETLMSALGKVAWNTYKESVGGKSINGDPLPEWEALCTDPSKAKIVIAWKSSAIAVAEAFAELSK